MATLAPLVVPEVVPEVGPEGTVPLDEFAIPIPGHFTEEQQPLLLDSRVEIAHLLQNAVDKASVVTAYYSPTEFTLTCFLAVEPDLDRLVFERPPEPGPAAGIASSNEITFSTSLGGIKIKFHVDGAETTTHAGRSALVSPLPAFLLRLQRREFFRVACPVANPVVCVIPFAMGGKAQKAEVMVRDLSLGGVTLTNQDPKLNLDIGTIHEDCLLKLPDVGSFATALEVRNSYQVTLKNGLVTTHSGCRFIDPSQDGLNKIQRYTMMLERQRNVRFARN